MGQKVTLGGDRLGSGKKMKVYEHEYQRSTHNLSYDWISSMACGTLIPFMCMPILKGDTFDIELNAAARTIPSKGFLFGSFKMQMDVFQAPVRLYQALLHNNPTAIGLKMNQVLFPTIEVTAANNLNVNNANFASFGTSSLMKYLGISGIASDLHANGTGGTTVKRTFNAIPICAYYDIFKNYYANKQEENAYVIAAKQESYLETFNKIGVGVSDGISISDENHYYEKEEIENNDQVTATLTFTGNKPYGWLYIQIEGNLEKTFEFNKSEIFATIDIDTETFELSYEALYDYIQSNVEQFSLQGDNGTNRMFAIKKTGDYIYISGQGGFSGVDSYSITVNAFWSDTAKTRTAKDINLKPFALKNIDEFRYRILSHHSFGTPFKIMDGVSGNGKWTPVDGEDNDGLPYCANIGTFEDKIESNAIERSVNYLPNNGICVKTYQSDIYNNWLDSELIEGSNGIAELTKVSVSEGAFKIDALNLAEKLYNMLNRVVAAGNTLQDWENAVYTESSKTYRHKESPIYLGGMSNEIVFDEIVQTTPNEEGALGSIGGKGMLLKRKGGKIHVKATEASFILGIASITPRLVYTQGNEWYMTEIKSYDDFHKPALDGIGYENLIGERMAYWDTVQQPNGDTKSRSAIGKLPAWIEYMTNTDKAFGDFAETEKAGYMVLARNYEQNFRSAGNGFAIKDATTYIDPTKYNYAFAYTTLDSQNFWVQIRVNIKARRLMSAKQIPNL